jgi:hypothetical protein
MKLRFDCAGARMRGLALLVLLVLAGASVGPVGLLAQSASAKPAAADGSSGSSASGFSIETEMLTYRALESNSEAIACEVAAFLHGTTANFKNPPAGAVCNVAGSGAGAGSSVIVLPFDRSVYADFQIWRSDMQTMAEFEERGAGACAAPAASPGAATGAPAPPRGRGLTASSTAGGVAGALALATPAGAALSTASGVLGLFAKQESSSPVGGTIQDQAFMDNVSRELRALNVSVLMPSVYTPYALTSIDAARSPFLVALNALLHTRDCLVASKGADDSDVKNIDDFLAALESSPSSAAKTGAGQGTGGTGAATGAGNAATPPAAPSPSHLESVLSADGLAQRLGADPATGAIPDSAPQHVLLVKALESGGSVNHSSSIFGSKMSFSGGSVGTYALFDLRGQVECSGNVYEYAGTVSAKKFNKALLDYVPDPAAQVIFSRGGCGSH